MGYAHILDCCAFCEITNDDLTECPECGALCCEDCLDDHPCGDITDEGY